MPSPWSVTISTTAAGTLTWTSGKPNEWGPIMASAFGLLLHFLGLLVFRDFHKGKFHSLSAHLNLCCMPRVEQDLLLLLVTSGFPLKHSVAFLSSSIVWEWLKKLLRVSRFYLMFWEGETGNTPEITLSGWELEGLVSLCDKSGCFLSTRWIAMPTYDSNRFAFDTKLPIFASLWRPSPLPTQSIRYLVPCTILELVSL